MQQLLQYFGHRHLKWASRGCPGNFEVILKKVREYFEEKNYVKNLKNVWVNLKKMKANFEEFLQIFW